MLYIEVAIKLNSLFILPTRSTLPMRRGHSTFWSPVYPSFFTNGTSKILFTVCFNIQKHTFSLCGLVATDSEVYYRLGCLYSFKILLCLTQLDVVQTVMSYLFLAEREREREREDWEVERSRLTEPLSFQLDLYSG